MSIIQDKVAAAAVPRGKTDIGRTLNIQTVIVIVIGIKNVNRTRGALDTGNLGILENPVFRRILSHLGRGQISVVLWSPGFFRGTIENIFLSAVELIETFGRVSQIAADPAEPGGQSGTGISSEVSSLSISKGDIFLIVSNILLSGKTDIFQLVGTLGTLGPCPCLLQSRQKHCRQNSDDRYNNQKF